MKIRSNKPFRGAMRHDVRKDFSPEQLQEIGALCMAFNRLEGALDFVAAHKLGLEFSAAKLVIDKVGSIAGKIDVIKIVARDELGLPEDLWKDTLDKVSQCKSYRDAVVHTQMVDTQKELGETTQKGSIDHVLLSKAALSGLFDFIVAVHNEFVSLHYVIAEHLVLRDREVSQTQAAQYLEGHEQRFHQDRQTRRALKPLPRVPDLFPDSQKGGGVSQ